MKFEAESQEFAKKFLTVGQNNFGNKIPFTDEHALMRRMMSDTETLWEKPIAVFGYNDAIDLFGGWLFEAETNCIEEHNMGQVASSGIAYIRTISIATGSTVWN